MRTSALSGIQSQRLLLCSVLVWLLAGCGARGDAPAPRPTPAATAIAATATAAATASAQPPVATSTIAPTATRAAASTPLATAAVERPSPTSAPSATPIPTVRPVTPSPTAIVLTTPAQRLMRFVIDTTKHPLAICNDGSTPVFYFGRGAGDGAKRWLLWFKGGFACSDAATCKDRDPELTSTNVPVWQRPSIGNEGILSGNPSNNPDFYNWNRVFMVYCSSDLWSGARTDKEPLSGFYYRGYYIANAIVDALLDAGVIGRPTLREATQVLVTGSSAGGVGTVAHMDRIAAQVSWADVRGASEANVGPLVNQAMLDALTRLHQTERNAWQPKPDDSCAAAFASNPHQCLSVEFLLQQKQLTTPMFLRADLYDPVPLDMQNLDVRRPADRPLIQRYANAVSAILKAQEGAFGTAIGQHVMMETEQFNQALVGGQTYARTLGNWYFKRAGAKNVVAALLAP